MRVRTLVCALFVLVGGIPARAQSPVPGWTLVVRIVPNPLPPGRCASISTEVQDDQGYRATALSNGAVIDFHKFRYSADTTSFQWRDGDPIAGYLCARPKMAPAHTTVTVTLPDGLSASVELSSLAPGQIATPARYPPQAPLKIAGVPPPKKVQLTAATPGSTSTGATIAATPDGAVESPPVATGAITRRPVSRTSVGGLKPSGSNPAGSTTPVASGGASSGNTSGSTDPASAGQSSGGGTSGGPPAILGQLHITTPTLVFAGSYSASGPRMVVVPSPLVFVSDGQPQ